MKGKQYLGINVLDAARQRVALAFDHFPRVYVAFSGGKDSTVLLHLVMEQAASRQRKVGVLFIDLECQFQLTVEHIQTVYNLYAPWIEPYWIALPIHLRNAVSMYQHHWIAWEPAREADWVRRPPEMAITDVSYFPFYHYRMEFEEFMPAFGAWYAGDERTACFVGIRAGESLNRWRTIAGRGTKLRIDGQPLNWTNLVSGALYNIYPIYDWIESDLWAYHGKTGKPYNRLYDRMYQAGMTLHQMRICQPYGDDQRKSLWLFHLVEPQTWARIVGRVNGANSGALYAQEYGNILGNVKITRPEGHTWESFSRLLLESLPPKTKEHYTNKIAVFLHWWRQRGYPDGIPDEASPKEEADKTVPSWRRICKMLLRNDYWAKGLSFKQTKSAAYEKYLRLMRERRNQWKILD
jgi:predicted phosphoadenosine phosphosulfate sulfurtransferase